MSEVPRLESHEALDAPLPAMFGHHPGMRSVYALVRRAAPLDLPVLVAGETGVGKELVARALHTLGRGVERPFVAINCAAVPEQLAEAELFGWDRGVFTGAIRATPGLIETAHGGTLFLDEGDSLTLALQAKLLRVIELKEVYRLGERKMRRADFRLVVAVKQPVEDLIALGQFRPDFAERVAVVTIRIPPLRERGSDLCFLAEHFLADANRTSHAPKRLTSDAFAVLAAYPWPRNVRQLRAVMERVALLGDGPEITSGDVLAQLPAGGQASDEPGISDPLERERRTLVELLANVDWDTEAAARQLRRHRATVYRRLNRLGIPLPRVIKRGFAQIRANPREFARIQTGALSEDTP